MNISRILLAGLTGAALFYTAKRIFSRKAITTAIHDIFFDTEFIPGTGKINQFVVDNPEMNNWFRTRQSAAHHEADDVLFI
jgi:hypothetical protein